MKKSIIAACSVLLVALSAPALAWYEPGYFPAPPEPPEPPEPPSFSDDFYAPPAPDRFRSGSRSAIRLEKDRYEQGYLLRVYTQGMDPADIQVRADRGRLRLQSSISERRDWQDHQPYRRASVYRHSHRRIARSVRLPYDADPGAMETAINENVLEIRIPRIDTSAWEGRPVQ